MNALHEYLNELERDLAGKEQEMLPEEQLGILGIRDSHWVAFNCEEMFRLFHQVLWLLSYHGERAVLGCLQGFT